jgi:hypothetical protein
MTVNYLPLESEYGFKSTGFTVDVLGNLTARTITATESSGGGGGPTISIGNFSFTGSNIDTVDSSGITFVTGVTFDSDIAVENDLRVRNKIIANSSVSASEFLSTGVGTPTISSVTNIELDADIAVIIKSSPLRLASLSTTQRNSLTAVPGDVIYNSTTSDLNFYNGAWRSLTGNITFNGSTISTSATSQNITISPQTGGAVIITSPTTGTLNNITIGNTTPAAATFTAATADSMILNNLPTTTASATRKDYVDNRITAFAIAFGA